jgi:tRNA dimethylallyltransferase
MGPTASGKTDLAIALAEALDLAVLSVDSRQLYRGMEVGTAKPTAAQRRRVRHELLDLRDPDQPINLQEFTELAKAAIAAEHRRRGVALLVGGSGLYLQALLAGLAPPAVPPQPALRAQLAALGQPLCHGLLAQADPVAAARIMPADAVRTQRALEVLYATGRPLSSQQGQRPPAWRILELGLNPPDLSQRIRLRTRRMYEDGLVEETAALLARFGPTCPLLDTIGYAEARQMLAGALDREQAITLTERRTRQYAKRQRTWFRRRHRPLWLGGAASTQAFEEGAGSAAGPGGEPGSATANVPAVDGSSGTNGAPVGGDLLQEALTVTQQVLG